MVVGIGVERGIEDMRAVAAKRFKLKNIQTPSLFFNQLSFFDDDRQFDLWPLCSTIAALYFHSMIL